MLLAFGGFGSPVVQNTILHCSYIWFHRGIQESNSTDSTQSPTSGGVFWIRSCGLLGSKCTMMRFRLLELSEHVSTDATR